MSPHRADPVRLDKRFPRVSGDEPLKEGDNIMTTTFSPRERG